MSDDEYVKAMEIQRRNFEAQFGSLEDMGFEDKSRVDAEDESVGEDSEEGEREAAWENDSDNVSEGEFASELSASEEESTPVVVKFSEASSFDFQPVMSKKDEKLARMGKIPSLEMARVKAEYLAQKQAKFRTQTKEELDNVEKDVALQRLLSESHILANSAPQYSGAELTMQTIDYEMPIGKARKRTLDSRLQTVAASNGKNEGGPSKLEKMPMHMRKGMVTSQIRKIEKYEQEAKDGGIILSRVKKGEFRDLKRGIGSTSVTDRIGKGVKKPQKLRDRGLKIHSVGRSTRNGIVISKEEIAKYNAPDRSKGKSGRGGSRGGSSRGGGRGSSRGGASRGFPTPGGRGGRR
ncbi:hypothetical protein BABINDRAFT_161691 [Babjeviella inositovora NRRL Y-12698]|uniref:Protein FAF1 n=1 Tax=Babjeviella inositovora NRRL Y-12698 TaxID=984486 RepID=A0A1E3QQX4_9ASCO|nr:uncharacterized protein BABINDRAFT_161691 [Babjeviella inositovora NRRL Y-12698]ODQ80050.1 hypothetical protein BABINDRAFT_161691 [Babjeviella inositovora NRRL Y-12698]